jgi:deoxyribodipyrimidine photo-lyase
MTRPSLMLFTRDLRVRDNPALAAAVAGGPVVPLFVVDDRLLRASGPNRVAFLAASLADLDASLRQLGGRLVIRRGDWLTEVVRAVRDADAAVIHVADDVSAVAATRLTQLEAAAGVPVRRHPGVMVVPAGAVEPAGGGEFKVFTPYFRRWEETPWRPLVPAPTALEAPASVTGLAPPQVADLTTGVPAAGLPAGGESAGLARLKAWTGDGGLARYDATRDDLAGDHTSRISPYLHFGCLSPLEVATRLQGRDGAAPFVRQLCWRDFYHQVLAARPDANRADYRNRGDRWNDDPDSLDAWCAGQTGYPVVDAGMRQLTSEGFMHNRARMIVASFLSKDLYLDWRAGAAHFMAHLVDGDVACNQLNWQWTAGTGTDTNPHRIFNPTRQSERFDPSGDYIRRWVPELAAVPVREIHDPAPDTRRASGYPMPLVDHHEAVAAYRARRT